MRPRGANRAPFPRGALTGTDLDRFYIDNLSQSGRLRARVEVRSCRSRGSRPFAPVVPPRSSSGGVLELRKAKASTRPFPFKEPSRCQHVQLRATQGKVPSLLGPSA
jgi:hypothetical protein